MTFVLRPIDRTVPAHLIGADDNAIALSVLILHRTEARRRRVNPLMQMLFTPTEPKEQDGQ